MDVILSTDISSCPENIMPPSPKPVPLSEKLTLFLGLSVQIVGLIFIVRLVFDLNSRILYPFIPIFASGLGLTVVSFSWLLFLRSGVGVFSPLFGALADRFGRRNVMALGMLGQGLAAIMLIFVRGGWAVAPMTVSGLSLAAFIPAQQAYLSDMTPFARRGRVLGVAEFAWSGSAILLLPPAGWLIDHFGWRVPMLLLGVLSIAAAAALARFLPAARHQTSTPAPLSWRQIRSILAQPPVQAAMGVACLIFITVVSLGTLWGLWLKADFHLTAGEIGGIATVLGLAELAGAVLSSGFIDRVGKKRGSTGSVILLALSFALLPLAGNLLWLAVTILGVMSLFSEFTIVALVSLYSEQDVQARGTVLALTFLGISVGAALGAPLTAILWENFHLPGVVLVDVGCLVAAGLLIQFFLIEKQPV